MNTRRTLLISLGVVVAMGAMAAWAQSRIGADTPIPVHFGLNGADRCIRGGFGLWAHPLGALGIVALFYVLPKIMPQNATLERSSGPYQTIWLGVILLMAAVEAAVIATALGSALDPQRLLPAAIGGLMLVTGNLLGKIRYNYVFGVRTPWTLSNERVWDRTHRFMGPWFAGWGALLLLSALFAPVTLFGLKTTVVVTVGGLIGLVTLACVYSYRASRDIGAA